MELDKTVNSHISAGTYIWEREWLKQDPSRKYLQESFCPNGFALKISGSTKVRLVHDLSYNHPGKPSVNDTQLTAHSLNDKISHILLLHRLYEHYATVDISKYYNSIEVSSRDAALMKFWWKREGILSDSEWEPCVPTCIQFGGRHSQALSQLCKIDANKRFLSHRPDLQFWIAKSYSDDICIANNQSVDKLLEDQKIVEEAMSKANFYFKEWQMAKSEVKEGEEPEKLLTGDNAMSKHLGVRWDISKDTWKPSILLNCSKKSRGIRPPKFDLISEEDVEEYLKHNGLSKRQCLGIAHVLFDPCNLWIAVMNNAKILYRDLITSQPELKWKDNISKKHLPNWTKMMKQLIQIKSAEVPRCALPDNWRQGVSLIISCDGGNSCSTTRGFLRADVPDPVTNEHDTRYLTGNSKLAETSVSAATKTEANALKLATQLAEMISETFRSGPNIQFTNVYLVSDSEVILTMCNTDPAKLKLWYQSRLQHAQHLIKKYSIKLLFCPSQYNDSDKSSKLSLDKNPTLEPEYWRSIFFWKSLDLWPVKKRNDKPDEETMKVIENTKVKVLATTAEDDSILQLLERFPWKKVVNILAFIYLWKTNGLAAARKKATDKLHTMAAPTEDQVRNMKKRFEVEDSDKIYLLTRPFTLNQGEVNFQFILLDGSSKVGRSLLKSFHIHVSSPEREYSKMMDAGYMITQAKAYFRRLQANCHQCKRIRLEVTQARLGPSPIILAQAGGPFSHAVIDLWGSFKIRVSRNVTMPGYFLTTSCIYSRYTVFQLMVDATADSLLTALKQTVFQVNGNMPVKLYSDSGRQILPIRQLETDTGTDNDHGLDINAVQRTLRKAGIQLITSTSAPYRQTCAESLHRVLRLNMKRSKLMKSAKYSISQWNFVASFMTHTINTRPLCLAYQDQNLLNLTPACLIFGKNKSALTTDLDLGNNRLFESLRKLEGELQRWKQLWADTYLIHMMRYSKWRVDKNELDVGSVVLITDHLNKQTGFPALGIIKDKLSDRSFVVSYIKRAAETDKDFNVTRKALVKTLERPNTKLVKITSLDQLEEEEQNIDPFDVTVAPNGGRPVVDLEDAGGQQGVPAPAADHLQDADLQPVPEQQDAAVPAHDPEDDVHVPADGDSDEAEPDLSPEQDPVPEPALADQPQPGDQQPQPGGQLQPPQPRQPPAMQFVGSKGVKIIRDLPKKKKK